ncbi:hypothetical protein COU77_03870 [Candidatus Peregrinibacteria bacterium CG10_big_fil_rev_8_21_14_0_10_49_16]|nr:MAG: hypothetical protein COW95_00820 [Candidatus Peregrinibacteria bacterium CG22_combo_CG10-13_8_21_14_all_49_11]PIR51789.1 MAG: hypothetical protein COU77_03870 [Candidatus Peregrinibacteria bacterium CG10_big_fil_rev_8_21_14_0_10_49_16]
MIYVLVFLGSFIGICAILSVRLLLRQRFVRRFVRSVRQRFQSLEERGAKVFEETKIQKPPKNPRVSAVELQQVRLLLRQAERAEAQGKHEEVERILIQALTIQPGASEVKAQLARLYLTSSRESKAEAMYKELLQEHDDVSFHANLGLAYYRQEKFVEACYAYQEAYKRDSKNPERASVLGRACIAAGHFSEAVPLLEKAAMTLSRDMELLHLLAECYLQVGENEKAEVTYRKINKVEPYNEEVKEKLLSLARA